MKKDILLGRCFTTVMLIIASQYGFSQIPSGYYKSAEGLSGARLKTALHQIINPHTVKTYSSLWTYFPQTDCMSSDATRIWDMYSANVTYFADHSTLEKEHCVPKSWWNEDDIFTATGAQTVQYSDMFNLYPADADANQAKLNYPLCEVVSGSAYDNGVIKVGNSSLSDYSGIGFEPADEYKGDFARTYLYMATCYQTISTWNTYSYCMYSNTSYPTLKAWAINLLLKWNDQDPVSTKEVNRNNAVYKIQGNRNPYIDHPEMIKYIWSDTTKVWSSTQASLPESFSSSLQLICTPNRISISNPNALSLKYRCVNLEGTEIFSALTQESSLNLNLEALSTGVYLFCIESGVESRVVKFIKQ